jgi:transcriptional regulator with XRE-family HTH domain
MNIGKAIKLCRTHKNLYQDQLAAMADISPAYLSLIEKNQRDPSFSVIENISKALNIPLSILVFLGADNHELSDLDEEIIAKLSVLSIRLISDNLHAE